MKILIINGPNLNKLGTRETDIYGNQNFEHYLEDLKKEFEGVELMYFQSNHEGEIIDQLHDTESMDGVVMNPAGFSHTSVAIMDAMAAIDTPVIEVHISNVYAREEFRQKMVTARNSKGVISGLGLDGYRLAIHNFLKGN
ncbi:type II 3-dehydroquinate dehydratase [bacterium SCSIO 12643]|nr:type II 3-dehydroquinate dehydratase [bacterium SCSIO 12643]